MGFILFYASWLLGPRLLGRRRFIIYECGFRSTGGNHKPFVAQYYILALMFLLFDIELLYLFPWLIILKSFILQKSFLIIWCFSFLLFISYLYEIFKGSLRWYEGFSQTSLKKRLQQLRYNNVN